MKNVFFAIAVIALFAIPNLTYAAGAQKYGWYLSGAVMPSPPYGQHDIVGSDTASKLIVNLPNGKVGATITGVMNGLSKDTTYIVYLSNKYTKYVSIGWNVAGSWVFSMEYQGNQYPHDMILTQTGTSLSGSGGYPAGGGPSYSYAWTIDSGYVSGSTIHLEMHYTAGASCTMTMDGTIASAGTMSGTWLDNCDGARTGTWATRSGFATLTHSGDMGWTGLYTSTIQPFTFTTDDSGAGSWHVNVPASIIAKSPSMASVWINGAGGTILVSDSFNIK